MLKKLLIGLLLIASGFCLSEVVDVHYDTDKNEQRFTWKMNCTEAEYDLVAGMALHHTAFPTNWQDYHVDVDWRFPNVMVVLRSYPLPSLIEKGTN